MPANDSLFRKYLSPIFVETGCLIGRGIEAAFKAGFNEIYSIELSKKYSELCRAKYHNFSQIHIVEGDSAKILFSVIEYIEERITFWLDGHHSGGDTALGDQISPLLFELEQIGRHSRKDHIILIDDLRCWNKDYVGFEEKEMKEAILKINPHYAFQYEDGFHENLIFEKDILVASI